MPVILSVDALADEEQIIEELFERPDELVMRFLNEFELLQQRLEHHPLMYQVCHFTAGHVDVRRALLDSMPYAVFYAHEDDVTLILRILHVRSDPSRWPGI